MMTLTWAPIGTRFTIQFEVPRAAIVKQWVAVRTNSKSIFKRILQACILNRRIGKVDVPVPRESKSCYFVEFQGQGLGTKHMLRCIHLQPVLVQLDTIDVLLDNILRANWVGRIITARQNSRDRKRHLALYYEELALAPFDKQ